MRLWSGRSENVIDVIGMVRTNIGPLGVTDPPVVSDRYPPAFENALAVPHKSVTKPGDDTWCFGLGVPCFDVIVRQREVERILVQRVEMPDRSQSERRLPGSPGLGGSPAQNTVVSTVFHGRVGDRKKAGALFCSRRSAPVNATHSTTVVMIAFIACDCRRNGSRRTGSAQMRRSSASTTRLSWRTPSEPRLLRN
jgi:hypothetical protein